MEINKGDNLNDIKKTEQRGRVCLLYQQDYGFGKGYGLGFQERVP